jgi:hypothetical protein
MLQIGVFCAMVRDRSAAYTAQMPSPSFLFSAVVKRLGGSIFPSMGWGAKEGLGFAMGVGP